MNNNLNKYLPPLNQYKNKNITERRPRIFKAEESSVQFSQNLSVKTKRSKHHSLSKSKVESSKKLQLPYEKKYKQLLKQYETLQKKCENIKKQKQNLEIALKLQQKSTDKIQRENNTLCQIINKKDQLFEDMRQQVQEQITIIQNLENKMNILYNSINSKESLSKSPDKNIFIDTFSTNLHQLQLQVNQTKHQYFENNSYWQKIQKDLEKYIEIKMKYYITCLKLQQREIENNDLQQRINNLQQLLQNYQNGGKTKQHSNNFQQQYI